MQDLHLLLVAHQQVAQAGADEDQSKYSRVLPGRWGGATHLGGATRVAPPTPIPLVYNMANLIGVDPSMHSFVYYFVIDLAILQKY